MRVRMVLGLLSVGVVSLAGCSAESVEDLVVGTCFDLSAEATEVSSVPTVDCSAPHDEEVFFLFEITEVSTYDSSTIFDLAYTKCAEEFEAYVGVDYFDPQVEHLVVDPLYPSQLGWEDGERSVVCAIVSADYETKLEGSTRNAYSES